MGRKHKKLTEGLTSRANRATILQLLEVSPGAAKSLWSSLRAVTRDEQRSERSRARKFRSATRDDWAAVAELREVPGAYLLADGRRLEQMQTLGIVLRTGDTAQASEGSGVPLRTVQRWVREFIEFAGAYVSKKAKEARAVLVRERNEFESRLSVARSECAEICNRDGRLGSWYESAGSGCEACPLRVIAQG